MDGLGARVRMARVRARGGGIARAVAWRLRDGRSCRACLLLNYCVSCHAHTTIDKLFFLTDHVTSLHPQAQLG